jgi:hypothetical protein
LGVECQRRQLFYERQIKKRKGKLSRSKRVRERMQVMAGKIAGRLC